LLAATMFIAGLLLFSGSLAVGSHRRFLLGPRGAGRRRRARRPGGAVADHTTPRARRTRALGVYAAMSTPAADGLTAAAC
jgi:hypothetical protein